MNLVQINSSKFTKLCEGNNKSLVEMALKLSEEVGEVAQAVLSHQKSQGCSYKSKSREDIIEELADVIMVAESMLFDLEVDDSEFNGIFNQKLDKWEEKTK